MNNQEAIRLIRNLPTMCDFTDAYGEPIDSGDYYDAVDAAISALEKQIPMKPLEPELGISPRYPIIIPCGNCGIELTDRMWDNCPYCGQAIDWGRVKDERIETVSVLW